MAELSALGHTIVASTSASDAAALASDPSFGCTDLSASVGELGSLLDHSGAIGAAEKNAARVFGADTSYFVLNGTSTANQLVAHSCVVAGDVVLADRNRHRSVSRALTVTDAIPVSMVPSRNGYGIIGPAPASQLSRQAIAESVGRNPLIQGAADGAPVYAVVTNSTYEGLRYRADQVIDLLGQSVPRIHFDEARFAYARFHPCTATALLGLMPSPPSSPPSPPVPSHPALKAPPVGRREDSSLGLIRLHGTPS